MPTVDVRPSGVKPAFWAYLRAAVRLIEAGKSVTQINLSKELRISHQAVWKFLKRNPGVMAFVDAELRAANQKYFGLVQRRMAILGMQGSSQHAEIFFKSDAGHYAKPELGAGPTSINNGFVINNLVPRPDMPALPASVVVTRPGSDGSVP